MQLFLVYFENLGDIEESFVVHKDSILKILGILNHLKEIEFENEVFEFACLLIRKSDEASEFYRIIL